MSILNRYKNRPKLFVTLPSKNNFYNFDAEHLSVLQEVGTMPLTIIHQLSLKNPEKLFNGAVIEEIIHDCTTIKEIPARNLLKCDVDYLLMAVKIATSGDTEDITCSCPKCGDEQIQTINLELLLSTSKVHEKSYYVDINTGLDDDRESEGILRVYIRPSTFGETLRLEQEIFEDKKAMNAIYSALENMAEDDVTEEVESDVFTKVNRILTELTIDTMNIYAESILRIVILDKDGNETPEQETDKVEIYNFLKELGSPEHLRIKDKMEEINSMGIDRKIAMTCENSECEHEWEYVYEVNMTDFFGEDS